MTQTSAKSDIPDPNQTPSLSWDDNLLSTEDLGDFSEIPSLELPSFPLDNPSIKTSPESDEDSLFGEDSFFSSPPVELGENKNEFKTEAPVLEEVASQELPDLF